MIEKRFVLTEQFVTLSGMTFVKDDEQDVDVYYTVDGTVDLLNQLADENEQLKQQIKDMQIRFRRKYDYEFDEIVDELDSELEI